MQDVVIVSGVRTPVGDFGGAFRELLPHELATTVIHEAVRRAGIDPRQIHEVILGNCIQRTDEPNVARVAALKAGLPIETTGLTVQRQCASSMQAVVSAAQQIMVGDSEIVVAGGTESMSSAPYLLKSTRWGQRMQHTQLVDSLWELLTDPLHNILMGETAENLAELYGITREEQDELALRSHRNAVQAIAEGKFKDEIISVPVTVKKRQVKLVDTDEHPRFDLTLEKLAELPPVFRNEGTVTAGNSSGINDGAAVLVLMSLAKAEALGLKPMARIVSYAKAGVEPDYMGYGPVPATQKALARAGLSLHKIDLIEINEAFAAQYLVCEQILEIDRTITNVNGSGISLGHPVGATGARILVSLLYEMQKRNVQKGLATLCAGGGMGMSVILEREKD